MNRALTDTDNFALFVFFPLTIFGLAKIKRDGMLLNRNAI